MKRAGWILFVVGVLYMVSIGWFSSWFSVSTFRALSLDELQGTMWAAATAVRPSGVTTRTLHTAHVSSYAFTTTLRKAVDRESVRYSSSGCGAWRSSKGRADLLSNSWLYRKDSPAIWPTSATMCRASGEKWCSTIT